jgi:threonine dehydrogenase-like Zn-dependent dehydrogenase
MFIVGGSEHTINDSRCEECVRGYPKLCKCKGLIHAQFMAEGWDGEMKMTVLCDKCGPNYKFFGYVPNKKPFGRRFNRSKSK